MATEISYDSVGGQTRRGARFSALTFAAIALVFVTVRCVRGDLSLYWTAFQIAWVAAVTDRGMKILKPLEKLETSRVEADETMQVLMQCAVLLPIAGCLPILWGL